MMNFDNPNIFSLMAQFDTKVDKHVVFISDSVPFIPTLRAGFSQKLLTLFLQKISMEVLAAGSHIAEILPAAPAAIHIAPRVSRLGGQYLFRKRS